MSPPPAGDGSKQESRLAAKMALLKQKKLEKKQATLKKEHVPSHLLRGDKAALLGGINDPTSMPPSSQNLSPAHDGLTSSFQDKKRKINVAENSQGNLKSAHAKPSSAPAKQSSGPASANHTLAGSLSQAAQPAEKRAKITLKTTTTDKTTGVTTENLVRLPSTTIKVPAGNHATTTTAAAAAAAAANPAAAAAKKAAETGTGKLQTTTTKPGAQAAEAAAPLPTAKQLADAKARAAALFAKTKVVQQQKPATASAPPASNVVRPTTNPTTRTAQPTPVEYAPSTSFLDPTKAQPSRPGNVIARKGPGARRPGVRRVQPEVSANVTTETTAVSTYGSLDVPYGQVDHGGGGGGGSGAGAGGGGIDPAGGRVAVVYDDI